MPNPFQFIGEIREMNRDLCERLDLIIDKIDQLIIVTIEQGERIVSPSDLFYGDGR